MVTYLGSLVQLCCGEGGTQQTNMAGVCGECLQCMDHTGFSPAHESYDQPRQHIKKQRHYVVKKGPSSQGYGFSSGMYGCESWTVKKAEC